MRACQKRLQTISLDMPGFWLQHVHPEMGEIHNLVGVESDSRGTTCEGVVFLHGDCSDVVCFPLSLKLSAAGAMPVGEGCAAFRWILHARDDAAVPSTVCHQALPGLFPYHQPQNFQVHLRVHHCTETNYSQPFRSTDASTSDSETVASNTRMLPSVL
jgi:hypothetical protein